MLNFPWSSEQTTEYLLAGVDAASAATFQDITDQKILDVFFQGLDAWLKQDTKNQLNAENIKQLWESYLNVLSDNTLKQKAQALTSLVVYAPQTIQGREQLSDILKAALLISMPDRLLLKYKHNSLRGGRDDMLLGEIDYVTSDDSSAVTLQANTTSGTVKEKFADWVRDYELNSRNSKFSRFMKYAQPTTVFDKYTIARCAVEFIETFREDFLQILNDTVIKTALAITNISLSKIIKAISDRYNYYLEAYVLENVKDRATKANFHELISNILQNLSGNEGDAAFNFTVSKNADSNTEKLVEEYVAYFKSGISLGISPAITVVEKQRQQFVYKAAAHLKDASVRDVMSDVIPAFGSGKSVRQYIPDDHSIDVANMAENVQAIQSAMAAGKNNEEHEEADEGRLSSHNIDLLSGVFLQESLSDNAVLTYFFTSNLPFLRQIDREKCGDEQYEIALKRLWDAFVQHPDCSLSAEKKEVLRADITPQNTILLQILEEEQKKDDLFLSIVKTAYSGENFEGNNDVIDEVQAITIAFMYPDIFTQMITGSDDYIKIMQEQARNMQQSFQALYAENPVTRLRITAKWMREQSFSYGEKRMPLCGLINSYYHDEIRKNKKSTKQENIDRTLRVLAPLYSLERIQELTIEKRFFAVKQLRRYLPDALFVSLVENRIADFTQELHQFALINDNKKMHDLVLMLPQVATKSSDYEREFITALDGKKSLATYFNDSRIQQYLLDQIAALEKQGNIGGADSMRLILNSTLSLLDKLKMLAAIGEGKSNNSRFSVSRAGRRTEVAHFYRDLQLFSHLESSDQISGVFEYFLRENGKIDAHIEHVDQHIQRYTLISQGLKLIDPSSVDYPARTHLEAFLKRPSFSNVSPAEVFVEIKHIQRFLHTYGKELHGAIRSTMPEEYDDDNANVVADDGRNDFVDIFSRWIQFSIQGKTQPHLRDLSFIGVLPKAGDLIDCCELIHKNREALGDHTYFFVKALADVVITSNHATQKELVIVLSAAIKTGSTEAQNVLNQLFHQAAITNNNALLSTFSEAMPVQAVSNDQVFASIFSNDGIQNYLFDIVTGLKAVVPLSRAISSQGIPLDRAPDSSDAMKKILQSDLPLHAKLQVVASIAQAKDANDRKISRRSLETQAFYKDFKGTEQDVFVCFVKFLMKKDKLQDEITESTIGDFLDAVWKNLSRLSNENIIDIFSILQVKIENNQALSTILISKIGSYLLGLEDRHAISQENKELFKSKSLILLELYVRHAAKGNNSDDLQRVLQEVADVQLMTEKESLDVENMSAERRIQNIPDANARPSRGILKAKDVKKASSGTKVSFSDRAVIVRESAAFAAHERQKANYPAELIESLNDGSDIDGFFYEERIQYFLISILAKSSLDEKDAFIHLLNVSPLDFYVKLRLIGAAANEICQSTSFASYNEDNKNIYQALQCFFNFSTSEDMYAAFSDFLKALKLVGTDCKSVDFYVQRHILLRENLKLILPDFFQDAAQRACFESLMREDVFNNPETIFDEIEKLQEFLNNNQEAIQQAISDPRRQPVNFSESFIRWAKFYEITNQVFRKEDLAYMGAPASLEEIIACQKMIESTRLTYSMKGYFLDFLAEKYLHFLQKNNVLQLSFDSLPNDKASALRYIQEILNRENIKGPFGLLNKRFKLAIAGQLYQFLTKEEKLKDSMSLLEEKRSEILPLSSITVFSLDVIDQPLYIKQAYADAMSWSQDVVNKDNKTGVNSSIRALYKAVYGKEPNFESISSDEELTADEYLFKLKNNDIISSSPAFSIASEIANDLPFDNEAKKYAFIMRFSYLLVTNKEYLVSCIQEASAHNADIYDQLINLYIEKYSSMFSVSKDVFNAAKNNADKHLVQIVNNIEIDPNISQLSFKSFTDQQIVDFITSQLPKHHFGGKPAIEALLAKRMPLVQKLHLLGQIGAGKTKGEHLLRAKEVRDFYRHISVLANIKNTEDVSPSFTDYLHQIKTFDGTITDIDKDLQDRKVIEGFHIYQQTDDISDALLAIQQFDRASIGDVVKSDDSFVYCLKEQLKRCEKARVEIKAIHVKHLIARPSEALPDTEETIVKYMKDLLLPILSDQQVSTASKKAVVRAVGEVLSGNDDTKKSIIYEKVNKIIGIASDAPRDVTISAQIPENESKHVTQRQLTRLSKALRGFHTAKYKYKSLFFQAPMPTGVEEMVNLIEHSKEPPDAIVAKIKNIVEKRTESQGNWKRDSKTIDAYKAIGEFFKSSSAEKSQENNLDALTTKLTTICSS